jgi:hypothetical protein
MTEGVITTHEPLTHLSIRRYQPGDEDQIIQLFHRVFGKERSLDHWRWKFQENPEGTHICLAVTDAGRIVGQYAGMPVRVVVEGRRHIFSQVIDSMVDRDYRRGLKKPGVYARLFMRFAEEFGGGNAVDVLWGFPTPEAVRINRGLLGYVSLPSVVKLVGVLDCLSCPTRRQQMSGLLRRLRCPISIVDRFDSRVDRLWEQCQPEMGVATIRDARYLNWRYAYCPDVNYRLLVAGGGMGLPIQGMAVLRLGWEGQPVACLMDWLVPSKKITTAGDLMQRIVEEARLAGMKELHAWFPRSSFWHRYLLAMGFQAIHATQMVVHPFTSAVPLELLNARWYYTMGDSDHY